MRMADIARAENERAKLRMEIAATLASGCIASRANCDADTAVRLYKDILERLQAPKEPEPSEQTDC